MLSQPCYCSLSYCCCMQAHANRPRSQPTLTAHANSPLSKQSSISIIGCCCVVMKLEGESLRLKICPVGNCVTQPCLRSNTHTCYKNKELFFPLSVPICLSLRRRHNISQRGGGEVYIVSDGESETEAWMDGIIQLECALALWSTVFALGTKSS